MFAQDKPQPPAPVVLSEVKSAPGRENILLEFPRLYSASFTTKRGWYKIILECKTLFNRSCYGTLKQEDGKSVDFDPNAIADKIVHTELIPPMQEFCRKAQGMDQRFWAGQPHDTFTDENGIVWTKQSKP
jgi:hypothetical protein